MDSLKSSTIAARCTGVADCAARWGQCALFFEKEVQHWSSSALRTPAIPRENLGWDPKKSYNFVCESGYFVNYCSFGGMIRFRLFGNVSAFFF